jgi:hypothetical protein
MLFFIPITVGGEMLLRALNYSFTDPYTVGNPLKNVFFMLMAVVFAPVCEELIYRSALLSGLKRKFNDIVCALLSGLAFSLMHMSPEQTVYQFFLGFGAALLTLASGSVLPAIAMHAASNLIAALGSIGVSFIANALNGYMRLFSSPLAAAFGGLAIAAAGVAAFIFGAKYLKKHETARRERLGIPSPDAGYTEDAAPQYGISQPFFVKHRDMLIYALALIVCAVMWGANMIGGLTKVG